MIIAGICRTHGFWRGESCERCRGENNKSTITDVQFMRFTPHTYEDICETPIHITSKRQLKEECKRHGVIAERIM